MRTSQFGGCLILASSLIFAVASFAQTPASSVDYSRATLNELIDALALIDASAPGINSAAVYGGFIADDGPGQFQMGVLGAPAPAIPPQMRELVRRGVGALPALISHLGDARPTKFAVGNDDTAQNKTVGANFFLWAVFAAEYDPRVPSQTRTSDSFGEKPLVGRYTVKIGDVCYVIIGQIVNRSLLAVRYQPSAGLVVNSPVETPVLSQRVKDDWGNANDEMLRSSLLADLRAAKEPYRYGPALARLRFYYPAAYAALEGEDLSKRTEFELLTPPRR